SLTGGSPAITYSVHDAADTATNQINTAYCVDEIIEVGFSNTSPDTAYYVRYEITLPAGYEIDTPSSIGLGAIPSDTSGVYPSYYQDGLKVYFYLYEEMAGSTSDTLTFTFRQKADGCGASLSGAVVFKLYYQGVCGGITTLNNSQSLAVADGTFPITVEKEGAHEVIENASAPFYVSFTYTGPLSCSGDSISVIAVDTVPYILDVADSGIASAVEPTYDDEGNTIYIIKWNITIDTSPYDWSDTIYLSGRIGECGGEKYNQFNVFYTDCCGCGHSVASYAVFLVANKCPPRPEQTGCVSYFEKDALPTNAVEVCKPVLLTQEINFPGTMPATVSWDELTFREQGRWGMVLGGDTASFYVPGCGDTVTQTRDSTAPGADNSTWYTWNLGFLNSPGDPGACPDPDTWPGGKKLFISYYGYFPTPANFFDWSELIVNDTALNCTFADPAGECCNDTYQEPKWLGVSYATLALGLSGPTSVDKCDTTDSFTMTLTRSGGYPVYDVRVNFRYPSASYSYHNGSTVFADLLDEDGVSIGSFEPAINGDTLTWNLGDIMGDINTTVATIKVDLFKNCENGTVNMLRTKANGSYDTYCHDIDSPDNFDDNLVDLEEVYYTPGLRSPNLSLWYDPKPIVQAETVSFTINVRNTGNAPALDVDIGPVSLGSGFGTPVVTVSSSGDPVTGSWPNFHTDRMNPGDTVAILCYVKLDTCNEAQLQTSAAAAWHCLGVECGSASDNTYVDLASSSITITQTVPSILDTCGDSGTVTVNFANNGVVEVSNVKPRIRLPKGLEIVPGTIIIDGAPGDTVSHSVSDDVHTYHFVSDVVAGGWDMVPGASHTISFEVYTNGTCNFYSLRDYDISDANDDCYENNSAARRVCTYIESTDACGNPMTSSCNYSSSIDNVRKRITITSVTAPGSLDTCGRDGNAAGIGNASVTIKNEGNSSLDNCVAYIDLPAGVEYIAGSSTAAGDPEPFDTGPAGGIVKWNAGTLAPGESREINFQVRTDGTAAFYNLYNYCDDYCSRWSRRISARAYHTIGCCSQDHWNNICDGTYSNCSWTNCGCDPNGRCQGHPCYNTEDWFYSLIIGVPPKGIDISCVTQPTVPICGNTVPVSMNVWVHGATTGYTGTVRAV
ncbi:DUF11 domain-containing protein, partial [bacterium]|nr:DUF11 domain-containing protein [bacterium]